MSYRDNPLMEPVFFTPPGSKQLYKGGGGGMPYYKNQDKLLGVQADIATNMYNQYAEYAPGLMTRLDELASEAADPSYAARQRSLARTEGTLQAGRQRQATARQLASMGVNPNDPRFAATQRAADVGAAANTAQMANAAGRQAEQLGWARTQDFYGLLSGIPSNASASIATAAGQYGQMGANAQNSYNQSMAGYGQFGGMIGAAFMADGGEVETPDGAPGYAGGGMPKLGDWRKRPSYAPQGPSMMDSVMAVGTPIAMSAATNALKPIAKDFGTKVANSLFGSGADAATGLATSAQGVASGVGGATADALGSLGAQAGADIAGTAAGTAAAETAASTAATTAGAEAAASSGAMAGLGSAMPWIGGALLLGNILDLWADGGPVPHEPRGLPKRKDLRGGGKVAGPGTETSDSIPAWLSDGEYVLNAEAVKQVGKKKLEKMNEAGLKRRRSKGGKPARKKG